MFFEDHSAKSFIRPEWQKLLAFLKQDKNRTDYILFTKWDSFSRNAPDAYQMINTLKKLGVEPQAVEQPLDISIPENKMMLSIYLTAPEIENDRRQIIGSMFPEKFTFENLLDRTAKVSSSFQLICQINNNLGGKKKGKPEKICLPSLAPEAGLEPATL